MHELIFSALSVMDGVGDAELNEYIDDGDEDDDFVDDYTNQGLYIVLQVVW